jgi:hypothetical protein
MREVRTGTSRRRLGGAYDGLALAASVITGAVALAAVANHVAAGPGGYRCLLANPPVEDSKVGYKLRGSRCEGTYANLVDGEEGLWLVGFQVSEFQFGEHDQSVKINVGGRGLGPLLLQVSSVAWHVHYEMDTDSLDGGMFDWNLDVFRNPALGLGPDDIAAVACTNRCQRDRKTAFLPVDLRGAQGTTAKSPTKKGGATLILQSGIELRALYITVLRPDAPPVRDKRIGDSYLPPERAIRLPVGSLLGADNDVEIIGVEKADLDSRVTWRGHLLMPKP